MTSMNKPMDPFENMRRIQESLNRLRAPLREWQIQSALIGQSLRPVIESLQFAQNALQPFSEEILRQQQILQSVFTSEDLSYELARFNEWQSTIARMLRFSDIFAPIEVTARLNELISRLPDVLPQDGYDELPSTMIVRQPEEQSSQDRLTWSEIVQLLNILIMIVSLIVSLYSNYENTLQLQEIIEIEKQQLGIQKTQLQYIQELDSFMKDIDHFIPKDQCDHESDLQSPENDD